jgi:hypothetical protein
MGVEADDVAVVVLATAADTFLVSAALLPKQTGKK